jgi:hypothetical protein
MKVVIRHLAVIGISSGLGAYWKWTPSLLAWGALAIAAYSVLVLFLEGQGIILDEQMLSLPIRPLP